MFTILQNIQTSLLVFGRIANDWLPFRSMHAVFVFVFDHYASF